jgi:hypothetical protein
VYKNIEKNTSWFWIEYSILALFRFLKDPYCSFRWVDLHTYTCTLLHKFNHMKVRGHCQIEIKASHTNRTDATWKFKPPLYCQITNNIAT